MAMIITPDKEEGKVRILCKPHFNMAVFFSTTLKKRKLGIMITYSKQGGRKGGVCNEPRKVNEEMWREAERGKKSQGVKREAERGKKSQGVKREARDVEK